MDDHFTALRFFRLRKFERCIGVCTELLTVSPTDQFAWVLKMQALTQQVVFDDLEVIEGLLQNDDIPETAITTGARAGTCLPATQRAASKSSREQVRTGIVRVSSTGQGKTANGALRTATAGRTAQWTRLGTASMLPHTQGFINVARLNLNKYASLPHIAKPLYEYLYFVEGNMKVALDLARLAREGSDDPYWQVSISRCLVRMGLVNQVLQSSNPLEVLKSSSTAGALLLAKAFTIVNQPLNAIGILEKALTKFMKETAVITNIARIHEGFEFLEKSVSTYKKVLDIDASNVEAIACIATYYFYNNQPEQSLPLYRRLLQMGIHTLEVFNNVALCCFYCRQYDLVIPCFENAISVAKDNTQLADVWYNLGIVTMFSGQTDLAELCWRVSITLNASHSESYNNLGVVHALRGHREEARSLFQVSSTLADSLDEPLLNLSLCNRTCSQSML